MYARSPPPQAGLCGGNETLYVIRIPLRDLTQACRVCVVDVYIGNQVEDRQPGRMCCWR